MLNDFLTWSIGALGAAGGIYGTWAIRKSKRFQKGEEDNQFLDSAERAVAIWEKLSSNMTEELKHLRDELKSVENKYNELRIQFEVQKSLSEFAIQQKDTRIKELEAEVSILAADNQRLKASTPMGTIKNIG